MIPCTNLITQVSLHILDLALVVIVTLGVVGPASILACLLGFVIIFFASVELLLLAHFISRILLLVALTGFKISVCPIKLLETRSHTEAILEGRLHGSLLRLHLLSHHLAIDLINIPDNFKTARVIVVIVCHLINLNVVGVR